MTPSSARGTGPATLLAEHLPRDLRRPPGCGHVPQLELPALTLALTRSFLHPGRRPRSATDVLHAHQETSA